MNIVNKHGGLTAYHVFGAIRAHEMTWFLIWQDNDWRWVNGKDFMPVIPKLAEMKATDSPYL